MEFHKTTRLSIVFEDEEMEKWAVIVGKLAKSTAGFQRPHFTKGELKLIERMDAVFNPPPEEPA